MNRLEFSVGQEVGIFTVTSSDRPRLPSGQRAVWVRCPMCNREFSNRVESLRSAKSCGTRECKGSRKRTPTTRRAPRQTKPRAKVEVHPKPGRWQELEAEAKQAFLLDPHYAADMALAHFALLANRELRAERKRRVG